MPVTDWSKPRRSTNLTTISVTGWCPTRSGIGPSCACAIAPRSPCPPRRRASSALATTGHIKLQRSSMWSPFAYCYHRAPAFTTSSTSASSSVSTVSPRRLHRKWRADASRLRQQQSKPSWHEAYARCSFSGKVNLLHQPPGRRHRLLRPVLPTIPAQERAARRGGRDVMWGKRYTLMAKKLAP